MFIDALVVKIRDGQVTNRPVYTAIGVTVDGERDILGLWVGNGGEGAKFWLQVLTEIKNRGTQDVCVVVCDGLKGLPEAISNTWPLAITQTCVLHLMRNTFRFASKADWDPLGAGSATRSTPRSWRLTPRNASSISPQRGARSIRRSSGSGRTPGPSSSPSWTTHRRSARSSTPRMNAVESLHARMRRATRARGHFPTEQAALKCLYLVVRSLDPTGKGRKRWMNRWKAALNAFAITFEGRILPSDR